ncbi:MAG: hypothetical protein U0Q16_07095 [Bryobacteraceae bacterium]
MDDSQAAQWFKRKQLPELKLTEGTLAVIERTFDKYGPQKPTGRAPSAEERAK